MKIDEKSNNIKFKLFDKQINKIQNRIDYKIEQNIRLQIQFILYNPLCFIYWGSIIADPSVSLINDYP